MKQPTKTEKKEFPILLYKTRSYSEPDIYLEDEDTLVWSGIGEGVTLSLKEMKKWIKQAERKLRWNQQGTEMNKFFENHIIIECEDITIEEENEIILCLRKILRRKNQTRNIRLLDDFVTRDL